jgi:ribulose 1,5-bisphosphate synthetase/thiazole synthase
MKKVDLVVVGGGLSGCMAAIQAAQLGLTVVLAEKREYPGREIAAYNHTFVGTDGEERMNLGCPQWLARLFTMRNDQEAQAPDGLVRQWLIDELELAGVTVLYGALPVGVTRDEALVTGVALGTPFGVLHVPARKVLDATERHLLHRILAGQPYVEGAVQVNAAFDMEQADLSLAAGTDTAAAEKALGLLAGSLRFHPSARKDTVVVEFAFAPEEAEGLFKARSRFELARVTKSWEVSNWLRQHAPGFTHAHVSHLAYDAQVAGGEAVPQAGLVGMRALPSLPWGFSLVDVADAWAAAETAVAWAAAGTGAGNAAAPRVKPKLVLRGVSVPLDSISFPLFEDDGLAVQLYRIPGSLLAQHITRVTEAEVCVIGAGVGGGMAMLAAAESGRKVAVLEVHSLFGGTHTVGRVIDYYDGFRQGMSRKSGELANAFAQTKRELKEQGGVPYATFLNHCAQTHGICVFSGTIACGVLSEGNRVKGVIAANEDGMFAITSQVTVDTTGNADVLDFVGAEYEIGDEETGMVQSYSLWGMELYPVPSYLMNRYYNDRGLCHPDRYSERLRAVRDGHYRNSPHHISPMVTVRESRRVLGEDYLTVRSILDNKTYDNVIAVANTRADSHAYTSSPLARLGGLGAGQEIRLRIPYGCFIPRGVEGLLVASKAMSGERDAASFCRMNADIKNAGYAIGLAASMAAAQGCGVREIDLPALQQKLRKLEILPDWAFTAPEPPDAAALAERTAAGDEEALLALLRRPAELAVPPLEEFHRQQRRGYTAHALAWFGSPLAGSEVALELAEAVNAGRHRTLPMQNMYSGQFRWGKHYGDDYTLVNRLIMFAGRSGHDAPLEPLARLIADTESYGPEHPWMFIYDQEREDMPQVPFYNRMLAIAQAAAERADSRLAPALDTLLSREGVTGYAMPLHSIGHASYMLAHAEICLARAAVRCGSAKGREVMAAFLNDKHSFFRAAARRELASSSPPAAPQRLFQQEE